MKDLDNIQNNKRHIRKSLMKAGELRGIIDEIIEKEELSLSEIATKAGLDRSYMSKVINGSKEKRITEGLARKLKNKFPLYFPEKQQSESGISRETTKTTTENYETHLHQLIASNKKLADAAFVQAEKDRVNAEANKIREQKELTLVQSNSRLTELLERTEGNDAGTVVIDTSILFRIQEAIAELGLSSKKWLTRKEALREAGILLGMHLTDKERKAGIQTGEDR